MYPPRKSYQAQAFRAALFTSLLLVPLPLLAASEHRPSATHQATHHSKADTAHQATTRASASKHEVPAAEQAAHKAANGPDLRILIDISGSMKKTDPENLRKPAVKLLSQLLPENSRAGIWVFGENVRPLIPPGNVNRQWRKQAESSIGRIDSSGLFTNIGAALDQAGGDLSSGKTAHTAVILLTDGMVDISKTPGSNEQERKRVLSDVLQHYREAGVPIHTIALSDQVDTELLEQLSLRTDGLALKASTPEDLLRIFNRLLKQEAVPDQLPLDNNRFKVDSSIEEFTLLVFHPPGNSNTVLDTPQKQHWNAKTTDENLSWYADSHYDLVTVRKPAAGEWKLQGPRNPDNQVTIVSNLQVQLAPLANNYEIGKSAELDVQMIQKGEAIADARFLDLLTVDVDVTRQEDRQGWKTGLIQELAHYRKTLQPFEQPGTYKLSILVDGKTFERKLEREVHVNAPVEPAKPAAPEPAHEAPPPAPPAHAAEPAHAPEPPHPEPAPAEHHAAAEEHPPAASAEHKPEHEPAAEHPASAEAPAGKKTPWWVYVAIALGNIVLVGLGYLGYRMLFRKPGAAADGEAGDEADGKPAKAKAGKNSNKNKDEEN